MNERELPSDVRAFQEFMNKNPELLEKVRKSGHSWQYLYEQWNIDRNDNSLGGLFANPNYSTEQSKKDSSGLLKQILKLTEKVDLNDVQLHAQKLDETIGSIQELLDRYQDKQQNEEPEYERNHFRWFRD